MFNTFYVYDLLTAILNTIITFTFYKIFSNSIPVIYGFKSKKAFTIEEIIGFSLLLSIAIATLGNFTIFGFNIKNILCILIVLILGWKNGILVGSAGGITIGATLAIIGKAEPSLLAAFAVAGLISGALNRLGKIGVIAGFLLGNAILTFFATGNSIELIHVREILIASLGLLAIPKNIEINITDLVGKTKFLSNGKERLLEENEDAIYKLNSMSETISEMAKSYDEAAATVTEEQNEAKEEFLDQFIASLSEDSNNMLYDDIINTDNGIAGDIYEALTQKEEIHMQDIIEIFEKRNLYIVGLDDETTGKNVQNDLKEITKIANESLKLSKMNYVLEKKEKESKKQMGNNLSGVSKAIKEVADQLKTKPNTKEMAQKKEKIEMLLLQKNIGIYSLELYKTDSKKTVISITIKKARDITDEASKVLQIEEILEKILSEKLELQSQKSEEDKVTYTYTSKDKLKLEIGIAKEKKDGSEISGDTSMKLKLADGKMLLSLSDGMGSGKEAQKASKATTEMIKKLFGSGFENKTAVDLLNKTMEAKTSGTSFTTIDISVLDLFNKNIEIIKNGSPATYIKREKEVQLVKGNSLPIGMLSKADTSIFDKDIQDGDIIIMCTDGIIDNNKEALNKEESLKELIEQITINRVQKMAELILKEAIDSGYGSKKDDMTVIVIKCVENK